VGGPGGGTALRVVWSQLTQHAREVKSYGGHPGFEVTGQSSKGAFSPGGASGADYSTTNTGNTGDADSQDPSGY
jgi:hypothetical protein